MHQRIAFAIINPALFTAFASLFINVNLAMCTAFASLFVCVIPVPCDALSSLFVNTNPDHGAHHFGANYCADACAHHPLPCRPRSRPRCPSRPCHLLCRRLCPPLPCRPRTSVPKKNGAHHARANVCADDCTHHFRADLAVPITSVSSPGGVHQRDPPQSCPPSRAKPIRVQQRAAACYRGHGLYVLNGQGGVQIRVLIFDVMTVSSRRPDASQGQLFAVRPSLPSHRPPSTSVAFSMVI
jgi:hypothetical protein